MGLQRPRNVAMDDEAWRSLSAIATERGVSRSEALRMMIEADAERIKVKAAQGEQWRRGIESATLGLIMLVGALCTWVLQ